MTADGHERWWVAAPAGRTSAQARPPRYTRGVSGAILTVGSRLGDHTLVRSLGAGGMGAVYLARSDQGAEHALKVIAFQRGERGQRTLQRFQREGEALAKVDRHPGIVSIHGCGVDPARGCGYLVLEFVDGSDLARLLDETRPLPLERALDLGQQIAAALAHVHAAGIVHRDLKPANVLLRRDGRAVLTDFGVARDDQAERMTRSGAMVGTAHYMSPSRRARAGRPSARTATCSAWGRCSTSC